MGRGRLWRPVVDKKAGLKLNEIRKLEFLDTPWWRTLGHLAACLW